ncbi:MAG: hypothetical protein DMG57_16975 [Acidobacteria bacterium]|nr:MAG: hypothetical protein DMG57_16975 [Acidobacteriota bacterium]
MNLPENAKTLVSYASHFGLARGAMNFLRVQKRSGLISVRVNECPHPLLLRGGSSDVPVFDEVFVRRAYWIPALAQLEPKVILDVGANVGLVSVFFASLFPKARIFAIEPEESNFQLLKRNTAPFPQITALQAALWNADEEIEVHNPGRGFWSFSVVPADSSNGRSPKLQGLTMPTILKHFGIGSVDLLKIDIEGAEKEVFMGACDGWLKDTGCLVIELHDRFKGGCARAFYSAIAQYPFVQDINDKNVFVRLHAAK